MPRLLFADDLDVCGESKENLKAMLGRLFEMYRRKGLKVNSDKRKVIVMNGEERLEYAV